MKSTRIVRIVTIPEAFIHFKPFLKLLKEKDISVTLVSSASPYETALYDELELKINTLEINRDIKIFKDLKSLISLIIFLRKNQFDIIHSSTPKAGLLTAIAGLFVTNTIRIHTFTGQRWANMQGMMRLVLKLLDKLIIKLNTKCYADSLSQIEFLKREGVAQINEVKCLHKGSFGGIDCERFNNDRFPNARTELLEELKLSEDSVLLLYVGRLTKDKGVDDLVQSFVLAQQKNNKIKLVLIGSYEEHLDPLESSTLNEIKQNKNIFNLGFQNHPEKYFSAADIFCLFSHREGFGTVVLEAAACSLATIGTKIPGLVDAILDQETGVLVELKNTLKLSEAILDMAANKETRIQMGRNAKERARVDFEAQLISEIQWQEYQKLLEEHAQ